MKSASPADGLLSSIRVRASRWIAGRGHAAKSHLRLFARKDFDCREHLAEDGFPIPPRELWHTGIATFEEWMSAGREHYDNMRDILKFHGFPAADQRRVLDFGCSSGRTVRLWKDEAWAEVWGCEIDHDRLRWCQVNLGHRFRFVQTTTFPHLPFEDRFFDLIYAGSVFTHIPELVDFWLLELKRITTPGGYVFITLHDEHTWKLVREGKGPAIGHVVLSGPLASMSDLKHDFIAIGSGSQSQTFYRSDYFQELAQPYFEVLEIRPAARGYQSAAVLRRPSR